MDTWSKTLLFYICRKWLKLWSGFCQHGHGQRHCYFTFAGSDSSCDLASVNKIIESTTTQNIQIFLKPQVTNSGSDDSEPQTTPWESADEDSDQSLEQLYKQSLNGAIPVKSEPDAENMAIGDQDEDEDPDEEEEEEDENEDKGAERNAEEDGDSDGEMSTSDAMIKSAVRMLHIKVLQFACFCNCWFAMLCDLFQGGELNQSELPVKTSSNSGFCWHDPWLITLTVEL